MIKYLGGSVVVLIIAFIVVTYGVEKSGVSEQVEKAMDVPIGEFETMGIKKKPKRKRTDMSSILTDSVSMKTETKQGLCAQRTSRYISRKRRMQNLS